MKNLKNLNNYILEKLHIDKDYKVRKCVHPDSDEPKYKFLDYFEAVGGEYLIDADLDFQVYMSLHLNPNHPNGFDPPYIPLNIKDDEYFHSDRKETAFDELDIYFEEEGYKMLNRGTITTRYEQQNMDKKFDVNINGFKYTKKNAELIYKFLKEYAENK